MSSEALERAQALLAADAENMQSASWWFAEARGCARDVIALSADLAAARARGQRIDEPASKLTGDESARIREAFNKAWDALGDGVTAEQRQDAADALERLRMTGGPLMRWHAVIAALAAEPAAGPEQVVCPGCDGAGWYTAAEHEPGCDESCDFCPVPVQRECETCGGSGFVLAAEPAATLAEPGKQAPDRFGAAPGEHHAAPGSASAAADEPGERE